MSANSPENDSIGHGIDRIGVEVEWPVATPGLRKPMRSDDFYENWRADYNREWFPGGQMTSDITMGAEINSPTLGFNVDRVADWYRNTLAEGKDYGYPHEPCGVVSRAQSDSNGNSGTTTAGMHLHLSSLTEQEMHELHRMSHEPWMLVFACSSVTNDNDLPFLQGGCHFSREGQPNRSGVISDYTGTGIHQGHYEWRLPEPMTTEHFDVMLTFLSKFDESPAAARSYAKGLVENGDDRLTAISRAKRRSNYGDKYDGDSSRYGAAIDYIVGAI